MQPGDEKICSNCGGRGFTLGFNAHDRGGNVRCSDCEGSGISGGRVAVLQRELDTLRKALEVSNV